MIRAARYARIPATGLHDEGGGRGRTALRFRRPSEQTLSPKYHSNYSRVIDVSARDPFPAISDFEGISKKSVKKFFDSWIWEEFKFYYE